MSAMICCRKCAEEISTYRLEFSAWLAWQYCYISIAVVVHCWLSLNKRHLFLSHTIHWTGKYHSPAMNFKCIIPYFGNWVIGFWAFAHTINGCYHFINASSYKSSHSIMYHEIGVQLAFILQYHSIPSLYNPLKHFQENILQISSLNAM